MKYAILSVVSLFCLSGCATKFLEKQSETTSQTAWAIKDSLEVGRVDLADKYAKKLTTLIDAPKEKLVIKGVYEN